MPVRRVLVVAALLAAAFAVAPRSTPRAVAVPVATDDTTYAVLGRVFPDPHGCLKGAPAASPWAKGNVCAAQFVQWNEALEGLRYLEERYGRYIQLINLREQRDLDPTLSGLDMQSAGLPTEDLQRDRRDLYAIKLTDNASPMPEPQRKHFVYGLSIHGIERAGLEGGIRAAEDLATWAAESPDQPILEPSNTGPTAGEVADNAVIYFILSNPDGWHRGEVTNGHVFFQRYNGNGMDINRDWAGIGYTQPEYTPFSEPETRGYAAYLKGVAAKTSTGKFSGGIDLHGMVSSHSFSFTLLGAGQRDYRKNAITVDTAIKTFRDAEQRLTWSPHVAPADSCPGPVPEPYFGRTQGPMCTDQWGTVWDTINYQTTGSMSDWFESTVGLDGVGIANEMALSHLFPNTVFDPQIEQLHIDGNKGLVYSQIASLLFEQPVEYRPTGHIGYVPTERVTNPGQPEAQDPSSDLPPQDTIEGTEVVGSGFEFEVDGSEKGVKNGSLTVEATWTNVRGIAPDGVFEDLGGEDTALVLERFGSDHPGDLEEWIEVARYFNQAGTYAQAGARIDVNDPRPGRYRIRPAMRIAPMNVTVTFGRGKSIPVPAQAAYDVANTDFFSDLNKYVADGSKLESVDPATVLRNPASLDGFDTLVLASDSAPGVPPERRDAWFDAVRRFAEAGGNVVLTDGAVAGLADLQVVPRDAVRQGVFFAGWMNFADDEGPTYGRHPLAAGVDKEGTAEGQAVLEDVEYLNRHQLYEPVPLGYYVSPRGSSNADCSSDGDRCDSPNWVVEDKAWKDAGGDVAARTFVREAEEAGSPGLSGVSLGELKLGSGRIRIIGALLPPPTEKNYHPFGLASYALTYTGYQVFENAVNYQRPAGAPVAAAASPAPTEVQGAGAAQEERMPATGGLPHAWAGAAMLVLALARRRILNA